MRVLKPEEFSFVGPTNLGFSPYMDAERSINMYYDPSYRGGPPALVGTPGFSGIVATLGSVSAGHQVRALWGGNGRLFAIGGSHGYEVATSVGGGVITDYGAMAGDNALSNFNQCTIRSNGVQLLAANPYSSQIYSFDSTPAMTSRFNGLSLEYLDGFFFSQATGASLAGSNPNQINASAFNDGTSWPGLAFIIKEGSADALNGLAVVNNLLWIFGQKNIEVWYNAGNPNFPLARFNGGTLNVGCLMPQSIANITNSVMWVGASERGHVAVYMARGLTPVKVSTPAVDQLIALQTGTLRNDLNQHNAYAYMEAGHEFYVLNLKGGPALVYDVTTDLWHERCSGATGPNNLTGAWVPWVSATETSTLAGGAPTSNTRTFVGDSGQGLGGASTGAIFQMAQSFTSENGTSIYRQRTAKHIQNSLRWTKYAYFELHADIGSATANLYYSNDGGKTFPTLNRPDTGKTGSNEQGTNNPPSLPRYRWWQLGRSMKRTFGIWMLNGSVLPVFADAYVGVAE